MNKPKPAFKHIGEENLLPPEKNPLYMKGGFSDDYDAISITLKIPTVKFSYLQKKKITLQLFDEGDFHECYTSPQIGDTFFLILDKTVKNPNVFVINRKSYPELGIALRIGGAFGIKARKREVEKQKARITFFKRTRCPRCCSTAISHRTNRYSNSNRLWYCRDCNVTFETPAATNHANIEA